MNRHGSIARRLSAEAPRGLHTPPRSIAADVLARIDGTPSAPPAARASPWRLSLSTLALAAAVALVAWLGGPRASPEAPAPSDPATLTTLVDHHSAAHRAWWMGGPVYSQPRSRTPAWGSSYDAGFSVASALRGVADAECPLEQEAQLLADDAKEATRRVLASLRLAVR